MKVNSIRKTRHIIRSDSFWNSLFKNSFWAFLGDSGAALINLVISVLIIRGIGSDSYGVLLLGQSYMLVLDVLLNVQSWKGIIQYGQKCIAKKRNDEFMGYVKVGVIVDVVTAIAGGAIAVLVAGQIGKIFGWSDELILCAQISSYTIFSHISGTATALLRIFNKFNLVAYQKLISSVVKLFALFFLFAVLHVNQLHEVMIIYVLSDIVGNTLLVLFAVRIYGKKYSVRKTIKSKIPKDTSKFLSFTIWGTVADAVDIPVNYLDGFIIASLGSSSVAVLKVFRQLVNVLQKAMSPIQQAIMPQFSELSANNMRKRGYDVVNKIHKYVLLFGMPLALVAGITSPIWLSVVYGGLYAEYWYIFAIYAIIQTYALSYAAIHPFFLSLDKPKQSALYVAISNIVYLVVAYLLVSAIGIIGAVIAFAVQCVLVIWLKKIRINKELGR